MKKLDIGVIVTTLIIVTISCSLAFFAARVVGEPKDINLVAKNVAITFNDTSIIANGVVSPGWNTTKTFTITNNSKEEYKYNISIKDLINTFVTNGYLQYKITSTNDGYNMTEFKDIPKSSIATDTILAYSVIIPVGVTQSYTIEFKYTNDESVDQSEDMNKKLSGILFITEGTEQLTLLSQILNDNPTRSERTDFSTPFKTNTVNTLYKAKEDNTDVYYFAGVDGYKAHCEVEGIADNLYKFTDGYNINLEGIETVDEDTCKTKSLCNLTVIEMVLFDVTQAQCQELAENQMGWYDESMYSEDLTNRTWVTELNKPINNWVKFGKNASNQDLYWRIIRTNSDGGVRLLYHGTSTTAADAYIDESEFNSSYNDIAYVSYMYGNLGSVSNARANTTNSTIKTTIDNWYTSNLEAKGYTKYISTTAVYCNDRTYTVSGSSTFFGAYTRLISNKTPTYDCATTEDKFTVDTSTGNGKLKYPIALMTADEVSFAGGLDGNNAPIWYYSNSLLESSTGNTYWWLLSPNHWDGSNAYVFDVFGSSYPGALNINYVSYTNGVRPAVSLKSCIKYSTGNGSASDPYTIKETETGC